MDILLKQVQVLRSTVIGRARIPLNEIAAAGDGGYSKTLILYGESLDMERESNGELEVLIRWIFDKETEQLADRVRNPRPTFSESFGKLFRRKRTKSVEEDSEKTMLVRKVCSPLSLI